MLIRQPQHCSRYHGVLVGAGALFDKLRTAAVRGRSRQACCSAGDGRLETPLGPLMSSWAAGRAIELLSAAIRITGMGTPR